MDCPVVCELLLMLTAAALVLALCEFCRERLWRAEAIAWKKLYMRLQEPAVDREDG